jgi:hypothetical protein
VIGLNSCAPIDNTTTPPGSPSVTVDPSTPPTDGPTGPTQGPTTGPPVPPANLPVYFVMQNYNNRLWLYREFHNLPAGNGSAEAKVTAAINEMLAGRSLDPDYTSPWPSGATVRSVQFSGDIVTVDLAGAASNSVGSEAAQMAVQQLVYTATAAAEVSDQTAVERVRLLLDGQPVADLWGHLDTSGILTRAAQVNTLGQVWLDSPQEGATVGRTFTVRIQGTTFEATVVLEILNSSGGTVEERPLTLDAGPPSRGTVTTSVTLPPGSYTLRAFFHSAEDGSVQATDDHDITVR